MTTLNIVFNPLLPVGLLAVLSGLALIAVVIAAVRRARGTGLRALTCIVLLAALWNPALTRELREPVPDVAAIIVDTSPSQTIGDRRARTETVVARLQAEAAALDNLEVRVLRGGSSDNAGGVLAETRLFEVLRQAFAEVPPERRAGAILVTDGQVHDVPENAADAVAFGPVHAVLSGRRTEKDRRLALIHAPSFGLVGNPVRLTIRVEDRPGTLTPSDSVTVTIRGAGNQVRTRRIPVGVDVPLDFRLDHAGQNILQMEVEAADGELTLTNNRVAVAVNGVRDRLRVLLVSGEPYPGERTWRSLLKADPSVDLVHFTILRPPEKQDGTPIRELSLIAFPIRELFELKLEDFDLIIFDRYRRRGVLPLAYLENIARYVRNGGALLEASGPTFSTPLSLYRTPLGDVLPGRPTGNILDRPFKARPTPDGLRHPVTAGLPGLPGSLGGGAVGAPENGATGNGTTADGATGDGTTEPRWGRWFRQIEVTAVDGTVLLSGVNDRPLLLLDRIGEGRVAQLTSDHIWLWSRGFEGGGPHGELLRRLAHWLMKEPALEENALRARADGTTISIERRSLDPISEAARITTPSGDTQSVTLSDEGGGRYAGVLNATAPGIYRVDSGGKTALAVVGSLNMPELAEIRTTETVLAPAVKASGGAILWAADHLPAPGTDGLVLDPADVAIDLRRTRSGRDQAGSDWLGLRANGDYVVTGLDSLPLLPAFLVLLLGLGLMIAGWRREGR